MIATVHYGLRGGLCGVGVSPRSDLSSRHHTITQYLHVFKTSGIQSSTAESSLHNKYITNTVQIEYRSPRPTHTLLAWCHDLEHSAHRQQTPTGDTDTSAVAPVLVKRGP